MFFEILSFLAICMTESLPSRYKVSAAHAVASDALGMPLGLPPSGLRFQ